MENTVRFEDIGFADAVFSNISSTSQSWSHTPRYYGYFERPRPDNGLVLIASDMTAVFETADGRIIEAHNGDVVFAPVGSLYKVDFYNVPTDTAVHSYTVNFEMYDREGNELIETGGLRKITHDRRTEFVPLLAELSLACNDIRNNQLRIMSKFYAFLDNVIMGADVKAENYYPIRRGVEVLSAEWQQNEHISRYAELCEISESYFHMMFKKWSGMSPVEYRNRLRITHAKTMLQNSSMSIGEVANAVGFEDQFYFSRVFRSVTGVSPQKYRKTN